MINARVDYHMASFHRSKISCGVSPKYDNCNTEHFFSLYSAKILGREKSVCCNKNLQKLKARTSQIDKRLDTTILRKLTQILSWCASAAVKDFSGMLCETD